ncbi:MAG: restriction endonuclease subunit S [Deltaproteobacteria bacterium]|nr:restriction endonuclease subunit S [Deltaproteobacteria bacterium]
MSNVDKVPADDEVPVRLCNYTDVYNNEFITLGLDFMQGTATETEIEKFGLAIGDVIITKDSESWDDIGVPALVRETASDLVCGYHLALLRPRKERIEGGFLFRCLQAKPVRVQLELSANGVTRFGIPKADIGASMLPVPPLAVQRAIADYLDRETARLDALVAAKERVLALLAEKRRALITRAVTRGLDPRAPLHDSGIPWLGEIPAHWDTVALRFLVAFTSGATPDTGRREYWDGEMPWVSPKDMKRGEIADAEDHVSELALSKGSLRLVAPGAVLIVVRGMILAHSFPAAVTAAPVTINQDMKALRCCGSLEPRFLRDFFRGHEEHVVSLADASAHGTRKLETEVLGRLEVALPPAAEQREIVAHIADATRRLDALRVATEATIALLKERRSALIAAAVTGQIDVGSAA